MPNMDGLTATRKIRQYEQEVGRSKPAVIIASTGLVSRNVQEEAFDAGISHFWTKPVRFKKLQALLSLICFQSFLETFALISHQQ